MDAPLHSTWPRLRRQIRVTGWRFLTGLVLMAVVWLTRAAEADVVALRLWGAPSSEKTGNQSLVCRFIPGKADGVAIRPGRGWQMWSVDATGVAIDGNQLRGKVLVTGMGGWIVDVKQVDGSFHGTAKPDSNGAAVDVLGWMEDDGDFSACDLFIDDAVTKSAKDTGVGDAQLALRKGPDGWTGKVAQADLIGKDNSGEVEDSGGELIGALIGPVGNRQKKWLATTVKVDAGQNLLAGLTVRVGLKSINEELPATSAKWKISLHRLGSLVWGEAMVKFGDTPEAKRAVLGHVGPMWEQRVEAIPKVSAFTAAWTPNPALTKADRAENLKPLPHGIPGQTEFTIEAGSYWPKQIRDGVRHADYAGTAIWMRIAAPASELWTTRQLATGGFAGRAAPVLEYPNAPAAAKYRFSISNNKSEIVNWISDKPWTSLADVWEEVPEETPLEFRASGIDADAKAVGDAFVSTLYRKGPFPGYAPPLPAKDEMRQRVLAAARTSLYQETIAAFQYDMGPTFYAYPTIKSWETVGKRMFTAARGASIISALSENGDERAMAAAIADRAGRWALDDSGGKFGIHRLQREHWWCTISWTGHGYLDLYALTGNPAYRDAAIDVARALQKTQLKEGNWTFTNRMTGEFDITGHSNGIQLLDFDASDALNFLGRLRQELNIHDFADSEKHALEWVLTHSARSSWWRTQFGHNELKLSTVSTMSAL